MAVGLAGGRGVLSGVSDRYRGTSGVPGGVQDAVEAVQMEPMAADAQWRRSADRSARSSLAAARLATRRAPVPEEPCPGLRVEGDEERLSTYKHVPHVSLWA